MLMQILSRAPIEINLNSVKWKHNSILHNKPDLLCFYTHVLLRSSNNREIFVLKLNSCFIIAWTCTNGEQYKRCPSGCTSTCANPNPVCQQNSGCDEGCYCADGYVKEGNRCIRKAECPCTHGTTVYPSTATIKKDCNTW